MVREDHWDWAFSLLVPIVTHQSNSEAKEICVAQGSLCRDTVPVAIQSAASLSHSCLGLPVPLLCGSCKHCLHYSPRETWTGGALCVGG